MATKILVHIYLNLFTQVLTNWLNFIIIGTTNLFTEQGGAETASKLQKSKPAAEIKTEWTLNAYEQPAYQTTQDVDLMAPS